MAREYVSEAKNEMGDRFILRCAVTQGEVLVEEDKGTVYGIQCQAETAGGVMLGQAHEKDVSPDYETVQRMAEHIGREGCFPNQLHDVIRDLIV